MTRELSWCCVLCRWHVKQQVSALSGSEALASLAIFQWRNITVTVKSVSYYSVKIYPSCLSCKSFNLFQNVNLFKLCCHYVAVFFMCSKANWRKELCKVCTVIWIDFHYFGMDHLNTPSKWKTQKYTLTLSTALPNDDVISVVLQDTEWWGSCDVIQNKVFASKLYPLSAVLQSICGTWCRSWLPKYPSFSFSCCYWIYGALQMIHYTFQREYCKRRCVEYALLIWIN